MSARLPAVDDYITKAKPFAQPILTHLREAVHRAAPGVEEQIKWSMPFFVLKGVILGNMAAFKEHCSFGLWGREMSQAIGADPVRAPEGMGTFGRITSLADLPPLPELEGYLRHAAELIPRGKRTRSIQRVAKPRRTVTECPPSLLQALEANADAAAHWGKLSPSCRHEYAAWIGSAKRQETQIRRVAKALPRIAEGKRPN